MITLITTLLIIYFSTHHQVFTIPDIEKIVKSEISDSQRREEASKLLKDAKHKIKEYNKYRKEVRESLVEKQRDREITREELWQFYQKSVMERSELHQYVVKKRLELSSILTTTEWDSVVAKSMVKLDKKRAKRLKSEEKGVRKARSELADVQKKIRERLDEKTMAEINRRFEELESTTQILLREADSLRFENNSTLQDQNSDLASLVEVYELKDKARDEAYSTLLDVRDVVLANTTEEEWHKVSKAMGELY